MSSEMDYSRIRMATKFSLWAWALYWPGGGLMLLMGGMPIAGVLLTVGSFATFIALIFFGQLGIEDSKNRLQLFLERPLYLVGVLFALAVLTPLIGFMAIIGVHLFGFILLAGGVYLLYELVRFDRAHEGSARDHKTDQMYIAAGIGAFAAGIMTLDAFLYALGAPFIQSAGGVAVINWAAILYPGWVLIASRGIMAPLRRVRLESNDAEPTLVPAE